MVLIELHEAASVGEAGRCGTESNQNGVNAGRCGECII
jgi:hypothetical protein